MAFAFAECIHTAWIHNSEIIPKLFMSNELETPGRASPYICFKELTRQIVSNSI